MSAINGFYRCNEYRVEELNSRIFERNIPSSSLQMTFSPRPEKTRQVLFPTLNCHHSAIEQPIFIQPTFNPETTFNPGTSAPYSGFASQIDTESQLKDIFMPSQKWCAQTEYVPNSNSDLYKSRIKKTKNIPSKHSLLFKTPQFNSFNPNPCGLGKQLLYNHTRQQVKDL